MRFIFFIPILSVIAIATMGTVVAVLMPDSTAEALEFAERDSTSSTFEWHYPAVTEIGYQSFELQIPQEEFEESMRSVTFRDSTRLIAYPIHFVDPDDKYVRIIAEYLLELTDGLDDYYRVAAALNFVTTSITYNSDPGLYGKDDFWAKPLETLYLKRGDCEDTTVLFCSIISAMGYDYAIVTNPTHVAACVYLDGHEYFCETAHNFTTYPKKDYGHAMDIYQVSNLGLAEGMNQFLADLGHIFKPFGLNI